MQYGKCYNPKSNYKIPVNFTVNLKKNVHNFDHKEHIYCYEVQVYLKHGFC